VYELISSREPSLGVLIDYPTSADVPETKLRRQTVRLHHPNALAPAGPRIAFIGAGNYASQVLIPAFKKISANLACVASRNGLTAAFAARKFQFDEATSDLDAVLADPTIDAVVIATRHDSHASLVCRSLEAGKHIFVEKPLALNITALDRVLETYRWVARDRSEGAPVLTVGFNRRFAPQVRKIKSLLTEVNEPKSFIMTVNAGAIPADHWVHNPQVGGGRVIGEGCHFIDLLRFLSGSPIVSVQATMIGRSDAIDVCDDKLTMTLSFADGSFGTVHYLANGHRSISKERLEVFCAGRVIQLDNFRKLTGVGWKRFRKLNLWSQDKGHHAEVQTFLKAIESGGPMPIPLDELAEVTRASFAVMEAAESRRVIDCTAHLPHDAIQFTGNQESRLAQTA
jgi:predicted dehydrogenase